MKNFSSINKQQGQVMLLAVVFFLSLSLTIVLGIAQPILKQVKISNDLIRSKQSFYLANGVLDDALYRVKNSKTVVDGETFIVAGYTTTISLTSTLNGKIIDATTNYNGIYRKMEAIVTTGQGAAFNYGIQAGAGGFNLSGGSRINGNVYANGPIVANNGVTITGTAISANSVSLGSDQANISPTPITTCTSSTCISFRNVAASQDIAQSFQVSSSSPLNSIQFYVKKIGAPSNITVRIVSDNSGSPGSTDLLSTDGTLLASQVTTSSFGWVTVTFPSALALYTGQTYWVVLDNSTQSSTNYYQIGANTSYSNGAAKIGAYGGSWTNTSPSGLDMYFNLYLGGLNGSIGGGTYVGAVNIGGDAWAHTVTGGSITGTNYCQTGSNNNKACTTTRTDPTTIGFPLSDAVIQDWKDEATTTTGWTYTGNLTIGYQGTTTTSLKKVSGNLTINGGGVATMGALEVTGDVSITGGGTLKVGPLLVDGDLDIGSTMVIKGTIYVKGNLTVSSGAGVSLDSSYGTNSGVIVTDGYIILSGGSSFAGSGQTGSFPMILTTSTCPTGPTCGGNAAIEINGGAGAVVLVAQDGTIDMNGGTSAKALTANLINVGSGASVTYDSGIADLNFSSGPSGGYDVSGWKEVQ
jgi:hypothetical protein